MIRNGNIIKPIILNFHYSKFAGYLLSFVCLYCISLESVAQQKVYGKVLERSTSMPLQGATITLVDTLNEDILAYTFSNELGEFEINSSLVANYTLNASFIGYKSVRRAALKGQELTIWMEEDETLLKEVVIKTMPIEELGDTLVYRLSEFRKEGDQVIADVLKRLPGVDVNEDGRILFEGKPINRFYINGLNLLDGKYSLASNHLPAEVVNNISVYKNHQPIQALRNLNFSESAGIDINLKDNVTFTGLLKLFASPKLNNGELEATPMVFKKDFQMINVTNYNTVGNKITVTAIEKDLLTEAMSGKLSPDRQDLLESRLNSSLSISENRLPSSNNFSEGFSSLKKLPRAFQLKLNVYGLQSNDSLSLHNQINSFISEFETSKWNTYHKVGENLRRIETRLELNRNTEKSFLNAKISWLDSKSLSGNWEESILSQRTSELDQRFQRLRNSLHLVKPFGKVQSMELFSNLTISKNQQDLIFVPKETFIYKEWVDSERVTQNYNNPQFQSLQTVTHLVRKKDVTFSNRLTILNENQGLSSQSNLNQIGINDLHWKKRNAEYLSKVELKKLRTLIRFQIGFNRYNFEIRDRYNSIEISRKVNALEPLIYMKSNFNSKLNFSFDGSVTNDFGSIQDMYSTKIFANPSIVSQNPGLQNISRNISSSISLNYSDYINLFFLNTSFRRIRSTHQLMAGTMFESGEILRNYFLEKSNLSYNSYWQTSFHKRFSEIKSQVKINYTLGQQVYSQLINGIETEIDAGNNTMEIQLNNELISNLTVDYSFKMSLSKSKPDYSEATLESQSIRNTLSLNYKVFKRLNVAGTGFYELIKFNENMNSYLFCDFKANYSYKPNLNFNLICSNIFNSNQIVTYYLNQSYQSVQFLNVRPAQLIIGLTYQFE